MIKGKSDPEARYRSLLQKAVRRGSEDLVYTTSALLGSLEPREKNWYKTRTAVITFEECWPLGAALVFNKKFHSKVAALIKVARSVKVRDATGLGYLAFALSEGETSVLNQTSDDRHIKIIANAIQRPANFWDWIISRSKSPKQTAIVNHALRHKSDGSPRDRAVIQAAAYLAVSGDIPATAVVEPTGRTFPFWVAFDTHTVEGRRVLRDIARDLHISLPQLEWTYFYFEGAATNGEIFSGWWDRHCRWYFRKIGLAIEEAHLLWEPAKPQVIEALAEESRQLHRDLYRWKLSNLERIESLKRQVEIFIEHFDKIQPDQLALF